MTRTEHPHTDNQLAGSTSPYLLQHADNPVDWRPWGEAAFAEARERDVPLFISIGYSTCHWCHVMDAETFSDPQIAQLLRDTVVAVKVDREELPGVDSFYMNALQALRGQGGWPLSAFATPDGIPFFAGTYFPPRPAHGAPSFAQVVTAVSNTYRNERAQVVQIAGQMESQLAALADRITAALPAGEGLSAPDAEELDAAYEQLVGSADLTWGGFGGAPKFPPLPVLMALVTSLRRSPACAPANLQMIRSTLLGIASGGIRDQLRGGISRYSVDAQWHVPHFEKMLSDNALYLRATTAWHRYEHHRDPHSRWTALAAREVFDTARFLLTDLALPGGGFASAFDADAPGDDGQLHEGAHALFSYTDAQGWNDTPYALASSVLQAPGIRSWVEGASGTAPWETATARALIARLRDLQSSRPQPARDDKLIVEHNGLAITALFDAAAHFDEPGWAQAANSALSAIAALPGPLPRSATAGTPGPGPAGLADHSAYLRAQLAALQSAPLFSLPVATDAAAISAAAQQTWDDFVDAGTEPAGDDRQLRVYDDLGPEQLPGRSSDPIDGAVPAGRSQLAEVALQLAELAPPQAAEQSWAQRADELLGSIRPLLQAAPNGSGWAAYVAEWALDPVRVATADRALALSAAGNPGVFVLDLAGPGAAAIICHGTECSLPLQVIPAEIPAAIAAAHPDR